MLMPLTRRAQAFALSQRNVRRVDLSPRRGAPASPLAAYFKQLQTWLVCGTCDAGIPLLGERSKNAVSTPATSTLSERHFSGEGRAA